MTGKPWLEIHDKTAVSILTEYTVRNTCFKNKYPPSPFPRPRAVAVRNALCVFLPTLENKIYLKISLLLFVLRTHAFVFTRSFNMV